MNAALLPFAFLALSACTAVSVLTHAPSTDLVDAPPGAYALDPSHTSVFFSVDHLGFSNYVGRFNEVAGTLTFDSAAPEKSRLEVTIETASIDANHRELEKMLLAPAMFDATSHPQITFRSTEIRRTGGNTGDVKGLLRMKGRERPVTLYVTFNGAAPNPLDGHDTLGFSATGTLKRSVFDLSSWLPAVGNEVMLRIEAEFRKLPS